MIIINSPAGLRARLNLYQMSFDIERFRLHGVATIGNGAYYTIHDYKLYGDCICIWIKQGAGFAVAVQHYDFDGRPIRIQSKSVINDRPDLFLHND